VEIQWCMEVDRMKCHICTLHNMVKSCTIDSNLLHHSFDDKPAIEYYPGRNMHRTKEWFLHGKLHRLDGPAIEYNDDEHTWSYNNQYVLVVISKQDVIVGKPVRIDLDVATVLRHVEGCFYEVLLGNKKVLIAKG